MIELNQKRLCTHCFAQVGISDICCPVCGKGDASTTVAGAIAPGSILHGRYVLGKVLGKGGFSITYLAYDSREDKIVAIKEFFPSAFVSRAPDGVRIQVLSEQSKDVFKRCLKHFYEEAQILSSLNHPGIVDIFHLYNENGTVYYTMEYLDGYDLLHTVYMNRGSLKEEHVIDILSCVADALRPVHNKGLLHRDISPDNVFITKHGQVKLIDFGAAMNYMGIGDKSFSIVLKHGFAPIEQYQRKGNQGPWTDIYALGSTAYYCLNGKMPPLATDRMRDPRLDLRCSEPLAWVLRKMMEVQPKNRYYKVDELIVDLNTVRQLTGVDSQNNYGQAPSQRQTTTDRQNGSSSPTDQTFSSEENAMSDDNSSVSVSSLPHNDTQTDVDGDNGLLDILRSFIQAIASNSTLVLAIAAVIISTVVIITLILLLDM